MICVNGRRQLVRPRLPLATTWQEFAVSILLIKYPSHSLYHQLMTNRRMTNGDFPSLHSEKLRRHVADSDISDASDDPITPSLSPQSSDGSKPFARAWEPLCAAPWPPNRADREQKSSWFDRLASDAWEKAEESGNLEVHTTYTSPTTEVSSQCLLDE
jgi:hypothetical protein